MGDLDGSLCGGLSWSPDGKYLAFRDKNTPQEPYSIYSLSVETAAKRRLTSPSAGYLGDWRPRFSPDGKALAFARHYSYSGEIFVLPLNSDGMPDGELRRLTLDEREVFSIDWTADGRRMGRC